MRGLKGISLSAQICMYLFIFLLAYVFLFGGQTRYIVETGLQSLGNMFQNFIGLSTYTDALRENNFPQNWTIFYWAYWMVWCVASPFFMGQISKGRTVKQIIMGTYIFGLLSTLISFIVLGNFGMGQQLTGQFDAVGLYESSGGDLYQTVIGIIHTLPVPQIVLVVLIISMIAFYSTSFDSITLVASQYSYKEFKGDEEPSKKARLFWALLLILLPIALIFSEGTMANMQSVSIIAAFPIALVIILIIASFIKDAKKYADEIHLPE
jgi:BCCT family betaine/carnitine transporter